MCSKQDDYFELKLQINSQMSEIISDICFDKLDCEGIVTDDEEYDSEGNILTSNKGELKIYLKSVENIEQFLKNEREILIKRGFTDEQLGSWKFEIIKIENQDWSKKWKENWEITSVGQNIKVVPSWLEYKPQKDDTVIILNPETAFGTGTHGTTQLCMIAEEKYMLRGAKVADIGTGTGILAITAAKLGANLVYGCDNDKSVIKTAISNAELNGVSDKCHFEYNTADKITPDVILNSFQNLNVLDSGKKNTGIYKFDFVVANVLHFIIVEIMDDLKALIKDDGYLVLSGILDEKKDIVLEAIKKHKLKVIEENHLDIWVSFVVKKDI